MQWNSADYFSSIDVCLMRHVSRFVETRLKYLLQDQLGVPFTSVPYCTFTDNGNHEERLFLQHHQSRGKEEERRKITEQVWADYERWPCQDNTVPPGDIQWKPSSVTFSTVSISLFFFYFCLQQTLGVVGVCIWWGSFQASHSLETVAAHALATGLGNLLKATTRGPCYRGWKSFMVFFPTATA